MRLTIPQRTLHEAVVSVGRAADNRNGRLPILKHLLLRAEGAQLTGKGGFLTLSANNLELAITRVLEAEVEQDGTCTVPAKLLTEFLATLPAADVTLHAKDGAVLAVTCGRYKANLRGGDPEEFPALPTADAALLCTLPGQVLKRAIDATAFAAAPGDSRPVLAGVLVRAAEGRLTLAAADGFRLAEYQAPIETAVDPDSWQAIIPVAAMREVAAAIGSADDWVECRPTARGNQLEMRIGNDTTLYTRQIEGQFPDYLRIIPRNCPTTFTAPVVDFSQAVRAASLFGRTDSDIVRLELNSSSLNVTARGVDVGDGDSEIAVESAGLCVAWAVNGRYLRDALDAIDTDRVHVALTTAQQPLLLTPVAEDAAARYVVMPMALNGKEAG